MPELGARRIVRRCIPAAQIVKVVVENMNAVTGKNPSL
jgi:hypothetical protein